ncbi:hypothetical protein [Pedobacter aquae]|uniref:hypothetical protein n=1 Tax=Pedobacter aquae TaxID=2605747 RepID=UPI00197F0482|nr:hypothetical protein [Pedobacter aquae]
MTKFIYIALITLIGFLLTPTDIYACGSKSENIENTCTKQSNTETEKKIVAIIKRKDNVVNTEKIVTETVVIPLVIVLLIAQTLQYLFLTDF